MDSKAIETISVNAVRNSVVMSELGVRTLSWT